MSCRKHALSGLLGHLLWIVAITCIATTALASESFLPSRLAHTYSIVARDPETGDLGVAVQSHWFSVGPVVPWAESGVGAVATQSLVDISYGPLALELLRAGRSPEEALRGLSEADPGSDVRQVAIIDAHGRVAAHTGSRCIPEAGHVTGDGYSVQANLMLKETVWPAMAQAYETADGDLAERMLQALEAAEEEGGDIRGRQSASILIVSAESTGKPWVDRKMDLRVEDSPKPLVELRRLVTIHRAYDHMNRGDLAMETGDTKLAMEEYAMAAKLYPENLETLYWQAVTMSGAGMLDEAIPIFHKIFEMNPNWKMLTPRLVKVGFLEVDEEGLKRIVGAE
jgi:uncharacterized Ntn-hydrolase superfamily protein